MKHRVLRLYFITITLLCSSDVFAQREYTVIKPRERTSSEPVKINTPARIASSKGQLVVLLNPIIAGQVTVKDAAGRVVVKGEANADGEATFQLPRGKSYQVEASYPGFGSATGRSKALAASTLLRLNLTAQFATLKLRDLPPGAQVLIDNEQRAVADKNGAVTISEIKPGNHSLRISHPEYNDFNDSFRDVEAGAEINYPRIPLTRVAKITVEGPAGANVLIDGAFQGRIESNGRLQFDYELDRASERTLTVEQVGYQTLSRRETLTPGPRTISVSLDPIVTSAGVTDFFDTLSQWNASPGWKIVTDARNKKLEVRGAQIGTLKDKNYRDFQAAFTIWLSEGKGATWVMRADKEGRNYYLFHLSGPNSTTHIPKRFYTYLVRDGGEPVEVSTPIPLLADLNATTSYSIAVTVNAYTIKHVITSNDTGETNDMGIWTDTTPTRDRFRYGTFGFRSLTGEFFIVDDFHIEPSKEN